MYGKPLAIAFSLLIFGQAYGLRLIAGTWLVPGCLFSLFWFFMSFVPLVLLWSVPIDPFGTGFIFLSLLFFAGSAALYPWRKAIAVDGPAVDHGSSLFGTPVLRNAFYLLSLATLCCVVLNSLSQGATPRDLIFNLIATAASYRDMASFGQLDEKWARLGEILVYAVAAIGGLVVSTMGTRTRRWAVVALSFIPGCFIAVAQSTKWTMFASIAFFYAGVLTSRITRRDLRLFEKGTLKKVVLFVPILFAVTVASFMSRGLQDSSDNEFIQQHMKFLLASYSSSHLYAFSDWCAFEMGHHSQIHYDHAAPSYGFYTFFPLFKAVGTNQVMPDGMYDDYYTYENVLKGNIYTLFRGLIQDFGVVGALVFMFLLGLAFHGAFYALLRGRWVFLSGTTFIFSIGFIYSSYGRSLFTWSSLYFTFVLVCILLICSQMTLKNGSELTAHR